ncbi:MAG: ABC transporter permease [Chloroflexota bacterium]|nr:ABC transporter permease [Chloroflexota bacterium]
MATVPSRVALPRPRRAVGIGHTRIPLGAYYAILLLLLYLPISLLFLFSINAGSVLSFPLRGLTLDWYARLLEADAVLAAARNSLIVAIASSTAATVLGTMVALLALRYRFVTQRMLIAAAILPLIVPFVVLGVALLILFRALDVPLSLLTVAVAHSIIGLPFTLLIVMARLNGFDRSLEEAAMDLGASYPEALLRIVAPIIAPALVSAWLTAFTVSFDEFALALFLAGTQPTFPVYLFSQLRFANRLPVMIALAVLMMVGTLVLIVVAEQIRRRRP